MEDESCEMEGYGKRIGYSPSVESDFFPRYRAERKAQIAMTFAEGKMAEKDFEKLTTETALVIAQKREQEAEKARYEAEHARLAAKTEAGRATIAQRGG